MELRQLKYFITVANELHFSRAAEKLNMTQPPLSMEIKKLEAELDVQLFLRTKRKVKLTEAGEVFLKRAVNILQKIEDSKNEVRRVHRGELGDLKLGYAGLVTYDLLPRVLSQFKGKYPYIEVFLKHLQTADQIISLEKEEIDVGLLIPPIESNNIEYKIIQKEEVVMALPKSHLFADSNNPIDLSELKNEPFIMSQRSEGKGYHDFMMNLCYQSGFLPKVIQEAQDLQTVISLVGAGMGIALLPSPIQFFKNDTIVYRPINHSKQKNRLIPIAVAWNKVNKSTVLKSFIQMINQTSFDNN